MMRNIFLLSIAWLSLTASAVFGQQTLIRELNKGEKVPDLELQIHVGNTVQKKKISDFKGKLLLLDFWGVHCTMCINALPEMQAFQKEFGDKIQILVVTEDSAKQIEKLYSIFEKTAAGRSLIGVSKSMPFIIKDTVLTKLFPHSGLPTHVWIGKDQTFYAMAHSGSTTHRNIKAFIDDEKPELAEKKLRPIDKTNPLSWLKIDSRDSAALYSFMVRYIEYGLHGNGLGEIYYDSLSGKAIGLGFTNTPILYMYVRVFKDSLPGIRWIPNSRMVIETNDLTRFCPPDGDLLWGLKNTYCYGLRVPPCSEGEVFKIMRMDMDKYFNIESSIQTRCVKCLVVREIGDSSKLQTKGILQKPNRVYGDSIVTIDMCNVNAKLLFSYVEDMVGSKKQYKFVPVLNEIIYKGRLDAHLRIKQSEYDVSMESLRRELQSLGLEIVDAYRDLEMLVIHDKYSDK